MDAVYRGVQESGRSCWRGLGVGCLFCCFRRAGRAATRSQPRPSGDLPWNVICRCASLCCISESLHSAYTIVMAGHNIDDDDYVANLLKQDAQKSTKQYQMVGLDAFLPNRYVCRKHPDYPHLFPGE